MRRLMMCALLAACSGSENPTVGEACTTLGLASCARLSVCSGGTWTAQDVSACQGGFVQSCCNGPPNTCGKESKRSDEQIDMCRVAIESWDCNALSQGVFPPTCITGQ